MFLSDQQKANKAHSANVKLLDLATDAIKEWDDKVSIRDEYTAKFLEESDKFDSLKLPNVQESPIVISQSQSQPKRQPSLKYDPMGRVKEK